MPRTPEQNKNIKDKRRSKLMLFALKAFAEKGYDKTAIDDITKPAKCSHGLFYHYFDSKETVFRALIKEYLTQPGSIPLAEALSLGGTKGLRLLCDYTEEIAKGDGKGMACATIILRLEDAKNLDDDAKRFAKENNLRAALVQLIKQGQAEGKVVAGDPKEIVQAVLDLASGALKRLQKKDAAIISGDVLFGFLLKGPIEE